MDNRNLWLGLFCILLGPIVIVASGSFDPLTAVYPVAVSALLVILGAAAVGIWAVQRYRLVKAGTAAPLVSTEAKEKWKTDLRAVPLLAASVLYIALLKLTGYVVLTPFLVGYVSWYLGYRNIRVLAVTSVAFSILTWVIFRFLLGVALPRSPLWGF